MGIIYEERKPVPSLTRYDPEFNEDGTEKHIVYEGARFHVIHWTSEGEHCSEPNCEVNKHKSHIKALLARDFK